MRRLDNPPNPYVSQYREWLEPPPAAKVEIYLDESRSILSHNDSPDIGFSWSVNPYRGCQHACAYCYARPTHEYFELGAGTDFDTRLIVKSDAPELLAEAFSKKSWKRELVIFSGVTDCYQPIEAVWQLTRRCLEVCVRLGNPASIVTKSFLVVRDIDVLQQLREAGARREPDLFSSRPRAETARRSGPDRSGGAAKTESGAPRRPRRAGVNVDCSIPFADDATARLIEPHAPPPSRRFEAMRRLHESGIPVGLMIAPVIPGLNDRDIPALLARAAECGASSAGFLPLRLPGSVKDVFLSRVRENMPDAAKRIESRIRHLRAGRLNDPRFGSRFHGDGPYWDGVRGLFEKAAVRYGLRGAEDVQKRIESRMKSPESDGSSKPDPREPTRDAVATPRPPGADNKSAAGLRTMQLPLFGA